ncbi:hypothetical protein KJ865_13240, partial [Myxococcota bacterium]|nr:hypothetical protein [Myxococcota bacterium]
MKWFSLVLLLWVFPFSPAGAKKINDLNDSYKVLDFSLKNVEKLVKTAHRIAMGKKFNTMERFMNGVYLLKNKRPQDAAALFMSLIDDPKLGKEATFYYSEAMYMSGNYLLAAEFYKKVMIQKWNKDFRSKAIKRILEISMKTQGNDNERITDLIKIIEKVIEEAPEIKNSPEVKYAMGKYAYYQGSAEFDKPSGKRNDAWGIKRLHDALALFSSIKAKEGPKGLEYPVLFPQAVYYSGATLVKLALGGAVSFTRDGKVINLETLTSSPMEMKEILLYEAIGRFTVLAADKKMVTLLKALREKTANSGIVFFDPKTKQDKEIQVLARMAIGRIFYEMGETGESIKWYKTVDKTSPHYEDALFELAWVYVRESEVLKAVQTLAIMEVRNKNSVFLPRAKLLLGYLKVRSGNYISASESFNKTSRAYKKVHLGLETLLKKKIDPRVFFDQIMRSTEKKGEKSSKTVFQSNYKIPSEAIPIFREDRNLMKAILISDDIRTIKKGLFDAKSALQVIKRRLQSSSKVAIFPVLNTARKKTYEYEFTNMELRRNLMNLAIENFSSLLRGGMVGRLATMKKSLKKIENTISSMPKSTDSLNKKLTLKRKVYDTQIMKVDNLKKDLETSQQFLEGLYKYYQKLPREKKAKLKGLLEKMKQEAQEIESSIEMAKNVRSKVVDASLEVGVDDDDMSVERVVREKYRAAIKGIFELFATVRSSMSTEQVTLYDEIITLLAKLNQLDTRMDAVNTRIYSLADSKLVSIKQR